MNDAAPGLRTLQVALNRFALALALVILAAIGVLWWRDRTRAWETPRWDRGRFVALAPAADTARTTWVVAVNPDCMHCRARLAELARHPRDPSRDPALAVLVVDTRPRPGPLEDPSRYDGGVYWDSTSVWRTRWGHRVYGEVFVFARDGTLDRVVGPDADPQDRIAR